jgi:hypothetical protein
MVKNHGSDVDKGSHSRALTLTYSRVLLTCSQWSPPKTNRPILTIPGHEFPPLHMWKELVMHRSVVEVNVTLPSCVLCFCFFRTNYLQSADSYKDLRFQDFSVVFLFEFFSSAYLEVILWLCFYFALHK